MKYKFIGTLEDSKRFAFPQPEPDKEYSVAKYKFIMDRNCFCLAKYFEKV